VPVAPDRVEQVVARDRFAAAPPPAAAVRTAILPFTVADPGRRFAGLPRELRENLSEMLERTPGIALARTSSVQVAVDHGLTPAQIGEVLDAAYLVRGTLGSAEGRFSLALELVEPASGAVRWRDTYAERPDDLYKLLGNAFRGLHGALLPGVTLREDPALRAVQEAQRLYWLGRRELFDRAGTDRAIDALTRAIALQPDYAIAYVRRAYAWRNLTFSGTLDLDEAYNKARLDLAKAIELDPKLIDAYLGEARMLTAQWRSAEALPVLRRAAAIAPDHPDLENTWADAEQYHGEPAAAFARRQRIRQTDPYNVWTALSSGWDLVMMGRREEALPYFAKSIELGLASDIVGEREARAAMFYGDPVGALEVAKRVTGPENRYLDDVVLQALVTLGRLDEARAMIAAEDTALPAPPVYADTRLYAFWRAKDYAGARAWIEGAGSEAAQHPWIGAFRAHALALAGDEVAALAAYDRLFADAGHRDLVSYAWYPIRIGVGELGNWAALAQASGRTEPRAWFAATLKAMRDGGTNLPALGYYEAVDAALRGDAAAAESALDAAIAAGFRDPTAFDADLAWRAFKDAPWLADARRAMDEAIARDVERARAAGL
jgi:tetratricopeptide (TPR) repeat protein